MISFSIGLALLLSGYTFYKLASVIVTPTLSPAGVAAPDAAKTIADMLNIPGYMQAYIPYIGIAVMAFGIIWFWFVKLMLYLSRPSKSQEEVSYK